LPETKNKQQYLNLKNNRQYDYAVDHDEADQIEVKESGQDVLMQVHEKVKVPLLGNVAAGIPILAAESFEAEIYLPRDWVVSPNETFALTVTGDSMTGAGIEKGDQVIV